VIAGKLLSEWLYFNKELTRVWQLDSCCQPGWAGGREPCDGAAAPSWRSRCCCCCCHSCCCCLSDGNPIVQLLKELTRVWQLDSCYQPGWAGGREPYDAAVLRSRCCCCCCHSCCCCLSPPWSGCGGVMRPRPPGRLTIQRC
jgi:hypothetical protein